MGRNDHFVLGNGTERFQLNRLWTPLIRIILLDLNLSISLCKSLWSCHSHHFKRFNFQQASIHIRVCFPDQSVWGSSQYHKTVVPLYLWHFDSVGWNISAIERKLTKYSKDFLPYILFTFPLAKDSCLPHFSLNVIFLAFFHLLTPSSSHSLIRDRWTKYRLLF